MRSAFEVSRRRAAGRRAEARCREGSSRGGQAGSAAGLSDLDGGHRGRNDGRLRRRDLHGARKLSPATHSRLRWREREVAARIDADRCLAGSCWRPRGSCRRRRVRRLDPCRRCWCSHRTRRLAGRSRRWPGSRSRGSRSCRTGRRLHRRHHRWAGRAEQGSLRPRTTSRGRRSSRRGCWARTAPARWGRRCRRSVKQTVRPSSASISSSPVAAWKSWLGSGSKMSTGEGTGGGEAQASVSNSTTRRETSTSRIRTTRGYTRYPRYFAQAWARGSSRRSSQRRSPSSSK